MKSISMLIVGLAMMAVSLRAEDAPEANEPTQTIPAIESVKKVNEAYVAVIKGSKDKYIKALQSLADTEQKKGNLDGIEELKPEIERMNAPEIMASGAEFKNPLAKKALDAFRKEADTAKIKYVADLQKAQADEVKAGKIDNAKLIKAYIARLGQSSGEAGKEETTEPAPEDNKNDIKTSKIKEKDADAVQKTKFANLYYFNSGKREIPLKIFDLKENLAIGGSAKSSSASATHDPNHIFSGNRTGDEFSLNSTSGTIEATWKRPVKGRYIVIVNKSREEGRNVWVKAKIKINNTLSTALLENKFSGGSGVLVIDFGKATEIKSMSFEIKEGTDLPGLVGLEIYK